MKREEDETGPELTDGEILVRRVDLSSEGILKQWDRLVNTCPWGKFFHSSPWLLFLERYGQATGDFKPHHLALFRERRVTGGFPLYIMARNRGVSLPFGDYGGPILSESPQLDEEAALLLGEVNARFNSLRAKSVPELLHLVLEKAGFSVRPTLSTYILNLKGMGEREPFSFIRRDARRGVRHAQREGVSIIEGMGKMPEDITTYHALHTETARRHSVPVRDPEFFRILWEELVGSGLAKVTFAEQRSSRIAGLICLKWPGEPKTLHIYSNVSTESAGQLHANDLLYWEAIQWARENGFDEVDMGLSPLDPAHSLCRFKEKWGAKRRVLYFAERRGMLDRIFSHFRYPLRR